MSVKLEIRKSATIEFSEATVWYEGQKPGLGADFVERVQYTLDQIVENPARFAIVFGDVREADVSRFPYCIYYRVRSDRIVVLSIFHTSRDPSVWQQRE